MTRTLTWRLTKGAGIVVGLLLALACFGPRSAHAAGFTVNTTSDTIDASPGNGVCADAAGNCSLRAAIKESNTLAGADTIALPTGTFTLTRTGQDEDASATGDLDIAGTITITGNGAANSIIDGNNSDAVFDTLGAPSGTTFNLSNLTVQRGNPTGAGFEGGGGIYIKNTVTMSLVGVSILNNTADSSGGGIWNEGNLTLSNSTVSGNQANGVGGGIRNAGTPAASLSIANSTISNNTAEFGGGIYDSTDGGVNLTITGSTLSGNHAVDRPGGVAGDFGDGGGIYAATDGGVTVSNSTLTGNTAARNGGAIFFRDDLTQAAVGTLSMTLNRVASNTAAGSGSGVYRDSGTATAEKNWWGCNAGPATAPCDRVSGTVDFTPWMVLTHSASPTSITGGETSTLTADFLKNSDATANAAGDLGALIGVPITFDNAVLGAISNAQAAIQSNGKATATFTAGSTAGTGHADATVDSGTATANITITGTPPSITTQPTDQTVTAGSNATFSAAASGNPVPGVQWQISTNGGSTWINIGGATNPTLSFTTVAGQNGYKFRAVFTNAAGSATSSSATLTVQSAPSVTTNPVSRTVTAGNNATFTAASSGNPAPTVQWQHNTGSGWEDISGETAATLTLSSVTKSMDGNQYRAVFTNSLGSATTTAATLTVVSAPSVTTQPEDQTVNAGDPVSFTAAASGKPTPTVQWQVNTGSGWNNITGATSASYSFTAASGDNGNQYRAVFTNSAGSATTDAAALTVQTAPSVTTQPTDQTVEAGNNATFTAAASGRPTPTVQWQVSTNGGGTWSDLSGETSMTLSLSSVTTSMVGTQYKAVFTNAVGSDTSSAATLTVHYAPSVTTQPQDENVNDGDPATFTAAASGNPTPTVQWQVNTGSGWSNVLGATSATYNFTAQATDDGDQYRAVFTNSVGSATSNAASLHVGQPTTTTVTSSANPSVYGQTVRFTATVARQSGTGTPTGTIQFKLDGSDFGLAVTLDSSGQAQSITISSLSVGGHTVSADFTPASSSNYKPSSGTLSNGQTVNRAVTATSLAVVASPQTYGQEITFTATVSAVAPGSGTPTGSVTFYDGSTSLGTRALSGGQATLTTSSLGVGSHTITATYGGDTNFMTSASSGRTFTVQAATTTLYNGGQMVIIGNTLKLGAAISSPAAACTASGTVTFTLDKNPITGTTGTYTLGTASVSGGAASKSVSTTGWLEGVYTMRASYSGPMGCASSYDEATLTVGSAGDAANGGGWATVSGLGRLNFGFTVKKVPNTSPAQYKGQFVMINNGKWRLKGTLDSYTKTSTRQGAVGGTGDLYSWDATLNNGLGGWQLYRSGVTFTASFTDNGTNLKTSPDKYGQHIDASGAPNFAPTSIKGGDLRVN